jgi:hypothetical protein
VHCRLPQKYLGKIDPSETIITPHTPSGWVSESDDEPSDSETHTTAVSEVLETNDAVASAEETVEPHDNGRKNLEFETRENSLPSTQPIPVDSSLPVDDATT